ncbi:hypothetical protein [Spiroplasma monobiae]|uniref:Transmembrane protein n=1 Tax=Spiroplasma monobiae MQ-1 TaxID=1336748 RepID=A0A2K9LVG8_SPISQ|nr:hypothetical protein [Spiroplasma monobiae]AUM62921.1 hypothetical protein SMONO_v1c06720 [Spiroplasma monobiae MQ-1]
MRGNRSISWIRTLLMIGNVFGLISGLFLFIVFAFLMSSYVIADTGNEFGNLEPYVPLMFSLVSFFTITNIFFCSYIINFLRKADDITLLNNRYVIALFSISIGGLFTPFVLAQMPNIQVQSTISPKFTISKGYGGNSLVSGFAALVVYFGFSLFGTTNVNENSSIFTSGTPDIIAVSILSTILLWGVINTLTFATPGAQVSWDNKGTAYKFMNFLAVINLIVATMTLILQLIAAVLSIISILSDMFDRRRGFLGALFNSMLAAYRIAIQLFIIYTINKIIKGLWQKGDKIYYQDYSRLAEKQREYDMNSNR